MPSAFADPHCSICQQEENMHHTGSDSPVKILLVGPDPVYSKGGMASVIHQITSSQFPDGYVFSSYPSYRDGLHGLSKKKYETGQLLRFLKEVKKYDIVHVNMTSRGSAFRKAWYVFAAKMAGKKIVIQIHCCEYFIQEYKKYGMLYQSVVKRALQAADAVLLLSEDTRKEFEDFFQLHACIHLPNSIRPGKYRYQESAHGVLFAGKLSEDKGLSSLMLAMGWLKEHGISEKLTVCGVPSKNIRCPGDSPCSVIPPGCTKEGLPCYKALASTHDVDADFTGWEGPDRLRERLSENAVMVLPSKHEGAPVSILEAMASGCAVIGTPTGAVPEMVPDGIVSPDPESIGKRLYELFSDPERIRKEARENYKRVCGKYDEQTVMKKLAEVYSYVLH